MVTVNDLRQVFAHADKGAAIGFASLALASPAVAAVETDIVNWGRVAETLFAPPDQRFAGRRHRRAEVARPADRLRGTPLSRAIPQVGSILHHRFQAERLQEPILRVVCAQAIADFHRVHPGQREVQNGSPAVLLRPGAHLRPISCHGTLAELRPANFKGGCGSHGEACGEIEGRLADEAAAQNLAGGIQHSPRVHSGRERLEAVPARDSLQQETLRAGSQAGERGYAPCLELCAQRRVMFRDAQQNDELGGRPCGGQRFIRHAHRDAGWLSDPLGEQRCDGPFAFAGLPADLNKDTLEWRALRSRRQTEEQQQASKRDALRGIGGVGRRDGSHGIVGAMFDSIPAGIKIIGAPRDQFQTGFLLQRPDVLR